MSFEKLAAIRSGIELAAFAKNYRLAGGTREAWVQAYDDAPAAETQSRGQLPPVGNDHMLGAEALHRMPGDGHDVPVGNDQVIGAHARQPTAGGKGSGSTIPSADHPSRASHGQSACVGARDELAGAEATPPVSERTTPPLPPTRELSDADRAAIFGDADHTFLETVKLRGKLLGNYQFGSLKNARALNNYENRIIVGLLEYRKDKRIKDEDRVKDVVTEKALREIVGYAGRSMDSSVRYG